MSRSGVSGGSPANYRLLLSGVVSIGASQAAATKILGHNNGPASGNAISGGTTVNLLTWVAADQAAAGKATKVRLSALLGTIGVAPGASFTFDLRPYTGAGTFTVGAAVAGSAVTFTTPGTNVVAGASPTGFQSVEFDASVLTDQTTYALCVTYGATSAATAEYLAARLEARNV